MNKQNFLGVKHVSFIRFHVPNWAFITDLVMERQKEDRTKTTGETITFVTCYVTAGIARSTGRLGLHFSLKITYHTHTHTHKGAHMGKWTERMPFCFGQTRVHDPEHKYAQQMIVVKPLEKPILSVWKTKRVPILIMLSGLAILFLNEMNESMLVWRFILKAKNKRELEDCIIIGYC